MKKARTINYKAKGLIEFVDVDLRDPGHGEVQVQALACGVCAWDVHVFKNGVDWPVIPGHEGVAQITKVGAGVGNVKEGDIVTGTCLGFTEIETRSAWGLHKLPDAAAENPQNWIIEPVSCVVTGLEHCKLRPADRIAIVGVGFMGLMFIQALANSLCDRLIAIDVDPNKLELAKTFGAHEVYDARTVDANYLRNLSLDTVVDCSGNQAGLELSSKIVKNGGRLNLFGWNHGTGQFPGDIWHMNGITVVNSAPNSAERDPWPSAIRLLERGYIDLEPLVTHVVPLDEYPSLLARAAARADGYIKGVVDLRAAQKPSISAA